MLENILRSREIDKDSLLEVLNPIESDIVYLSGSLIEGFGNSRSDIDAFNISDRAEKKFQKVIKLRNEDIHYEIWPYSTIRDMMKTLNSIDVNNQDASVHIFSRDEKKFLHRLFIGIPLKNERGFEKIKNQFRWDIFKRINIRFYINVYDNTFEDVYGPLEDGELLTAYFRSHQLLNNAMEAYVASLGETNVQSKWLIRKIQRHLDKEDRIYKKYLDFFFREVKKQELKDYILEIIDFCEELLMKVQQKIGSI